MVFNPDVESAITSRINAVAQQTYYNALASGQTQNQALEAAKFAWQQKLDEANQTGMWNGQWNNPQEQWFTGQFGQWYGAGGAPNVGDLTQQAQQQQYNQQQGYGQMYGQYYAPGTTPMQGTATQQAQQNAANLAAQKAGLTGYLQNTGTGNIVADAWNMLDRATQQQYMQTSPGGTDAQEAMGRYYANLQDSVRNRAAEAGQTFTPETMNTYVYGAWGPGTQTLQGNEQDFTQNLRTQQEARAAQAQQQGQTQSYLNLLASLRGPADWAKYQQVLGSTPNGMRDLAAAAMGQYTPGGGATTGYQPQAASLQSLMGDVSGQAYYGQGGGQLGQPNVYQGGQGSYGPQSNGEVWGSGLGVGQQGATPQQQQQATGNGTNLYGGQQSQYNLPAPNQIAAQSWKNMAPSQQQMLLGQYESQGWDKNDVQALYNQSLPKYASGGAATGTFRF